MECAVDCGILILVQRILSGIFGVAVAAGLASCKSSPPAGRGDAGSVPMLSTDAARAAGFSDQEATEAHDLYALKCARCHKFYNPTDYSPKDWDMWMHKMSRKSKLKPAQEALLARYLDEFREKNAPVAPK